MREELKPCKFAIKISEEDRGGADVDQKHPEIPGDWFALSSGKERRIMTPKDIVSRP